MKLSAFAHEGAEQIGIVQEDGVRPISGVEALLDAGRLIESANARVSPKAVAISAIQWLPPLDPAATMFCVGRNYAAHAAEAGISLPDYPNVFLRSRRSLVGHGEPIVAPKVSSSLDFEGELAVVIGRRGRHIPRDKALAHVLGYTCFNDVSVRDYQFDHSLTVGKNFWRSGSLGPWIVTADEFALDRASVRTVLNGREVQSAPVSDLIFDVAYLVSYLSTITELNPGDVIATGTPEGVGFSRKPPLWLKPGDRIEVEIAGLGRLENPVISE